MLDFPSLCVPFPSLFFSWIFEFSSLERSIAICLVGFGKQNFIVFFSSRSIPSAWAELLGVWGFVLLLRL